MCVLSQYNISFKLHTVLNVFSCMKVSISCDARVLSPSPWFPPSLAPQGEKMVSVKSDQRVGSAPGGTVTAVLDYCDVCDVNIVLEALGVSNSGDQ